MAHRPGSTGHHSKGLLSVPKGEPTIIRSAIQTFSRPLKAERLVVKQSAKWDNWEQVPNIGPEGTSDAPILLAVADGEYWYFARHQKGYSAFFSNDLQTWKNFGPVAPTQFADSPLQTGKKKKKAPKKASAPGWCTTAEYIDSKIHLYYDQPNDQDPHLLVGTPGKDSIQWTAHGMVFADPSHGSDCAVIRTDDGTVHLIYEDWTPIDARAHSWDSPLAGHVSSPDGINGSKAGTHKPAVDKRTTPTGKFGTFNHRATGPDPLQYEIHEPAQPAYGDWTATQIGDRYYHLHAAGMLMVDIADPKNFVFEMGRGRIKEMHELRNEDPFDIDFD